MAGSLRLTRLSVGLGVLFASGLVAGAGDIPRFPAYGSKPGPARPEAVRRPAAYDLSSLPVYFEKDPAGARFQTRTSRAGLLFDAGGFWLGLGSGEDSVRVEFQGARRGAEPAGQQALPAFSNYFVGNHPSQWRTRRQHYAGVRYDALWPGVDLVFYAQRRELEYDFNVAPHADASRIRLKVEGADSVTIDEQGELRIASQGGKTRQHRPVIYQEIDGRRVDIAGGYRLAGKNEVGFWLGDYDRSRKLTIDPVLEFSTYLGGGGFDLATAVAVDSSNNIYVTGYTQFADFKTTPAGQRLTNSASSGPNVFVVKLDALGKQIDYIDFWGGSTYEFPWSIAVDAQGVATVVGETQSTDIPLMGAILSRMIPGNSYGFVARFNSNGSLAYSTYTAPGVLYGVAATTSVVWVAGATICNAGYSDPAYQLQTTSGAQQATCATPDAGIGYLMRLAASGAVQYASFYVPSGGSGYSTGISDVTLDPQGNAYIAGTMPGDYWLTKATWTGSGFANEQWLNLVCEVTKFNPNGQAQWVQKLDGEMDQECLRIAADKNSNVYVTGYTTSQHFRVTQGAFQTVLGSPGRIPQDPLAPSWFGDVSTRPMWDGMAAEISTNGALLYSTYLGGSGDDYGFGIAVNGSGNAFVTGYTNSVNFPVTPGAVQTAYGGGQGDAYVTGFAPNGSSLAFSTFYGGSGQDEGYQVAADSLGNVYLAGGTASSDLPLSSDALQKTSQNADGMVAKFNLQPCNPALALSNPVLSAAAGSASLTLTPDVPGCSWTLSTTSTWLQFNPATGSGQGTVAMTVAANTSSQSRLAIITANSRRSFVYQAGQSNCQFVFAPGEMALSSGSERHLVLIQAADRTCTWAASSDQPWLHVLASSGGPGTGTMTIGTDQNTSSAVRTGHLTVDTQRIVVGQSAGGCAISLSAGANSFGPAGGIGTVTVLASSSLCSWQPQSQNPDWIVLPSTAAGTSYGRGTIRFSVLPNSTTGARTGTLSVSGHSITISQDSLFNSLESLAGNYPSSASPSLSPALRGRMGKGGSAAQLQPAVTPPAPRLGGCGSVSPPNEIQLNSNGDSVTVTVTRAATGCGPSATVRGDNWLRVTPSIYPSNSPKIVTFTLSADANQLSGTRSNTITVGTGDSAQPVWTWTVVQAGVPAAPLSVPSALTLQADASSLAIPVSSANPSVPACSWSVDSTTLPAWITPAATTGACGAQLQFSYAANLAGSLRRAYLKFTSGDQTELDQAAGAAPCTYSFQQTSPQNVASSGGTVTFNVVTAAGCTWSPSTDSPDWIGFPQSSTGPGPGLLTVQVAANNTSGQQQAQIFVDAATAYVLQAAGSFPTGCVYTLSPTSQSVPNTGGSFSFQVQTTAICTWQPTQPAADASWVHLQSTAMVTGPGTVSFTVDGNAAGSAARPSSITVALGDTFSISQDAGPTPVCSYTLVPSSNGFTNAGGSFSFQVQTTSSCAWQPSQPSSDASWVHLQSTASVTGAGTVNFTVDANAAGSAARSSSITVAAGVTFSISEAAGPTPVCSYTLVPSSNSFTNAGGSFSFQVQTTSSCAWQPSQPASDASWVHLQSTASVTGAGTVNFTVDANAAGSPARSSSITVAAGVTFGISEAAGPTPVCSYTLVPSSNGFTNAGGSFSFQVQTTASCSWQPSQPAADASWVHLQSTASVTGAGTVNFTVDANAAGSPARSSSIGVAAATFSITEAAGPALGPAPVFTSAGVLNGASFLAGGVSPGEIVTVKGTGLGPALGVSSALTGTKFPTLWSGTQVLFDGVAVPVIYTSGVQVNAIAPYSIAGKSSTQVQVVYNGVASSAVAVAVVASAPALFSMGDGTGQGAILNSNALVNSTSNPAAPGDEIVLFGTGEGLTNPPGVDGQIAVSVYPKPVLPVSVTIGGVDAQIAYVGAAPTLVAGVMQVNVFVPSGLQGTQPVVLKVGSNSGPASVTMALKIAAPPASGSLQASPNPMNVCSAGAAATVTLSWSTSNVTSVKVVTGSLSGAVVATGGPTGSVTVTGTPGTAYLLVDTSGGGTPAAANILSTVTLQQGTCPAPASGTLQASPNPMNVCTATSTANVTLSWSTSNVTSVKVVTGSLTGAVVVSGGRTGSFTVTGTPGTAYLLVDTSGGGTPAAANILSTVTLQQGTCPVPPSGTLQASPNPMNVCSATSTANATLSWTASNVTSVKVVTGSLTGAVVATGGPTGSVTVTGTPGTAYLLVDTSGGGTPAAANILSTVTLQQGTCPAGGPPPTADLAQSVSNWQIQYLNNGGVATGVGVDDTSPADILDGSSSIYVYSVTANTILMTMTAPASASIPRWDMSALKTVQISMQSDVTPGTWNLGSPSFTLKSANGSLTLSPVSASAADPSYNGWETLTAPLAGNANWQAATSGQFDIRNVTSIQIGLSVSGTNWALLLNAMFLK